MSTDRPNVLLVVADDLRFDVLRNDAVHTPNFDRLIEEGMAFTHAYNMGSHSGAVCVPARAMIHSGRSLFHLDGQHGITRAHPMLGEAFENADYRTFGTGKWHNGTESFNRSFAEGQDILFEGIDNHWNAPVTDRHPKGEYPELPSHPNDMGTGYVGPGRQVAERYASGIHSTDLFVSATIDFLQDATNDDRPFFSYLATMEPHDPRTPPGEFLRRYDHHGIDLANNFAERHPFDNGELDIRDERLADLPRDPDEVRRHVADYYASVSHLDHHLGRVLDVLEAAGEREDTIVAATADHGLAVGRHGLMGKQNLYEHSVRVPLILAGPGVPAGERREALCYQCDLNPTLRDLCDFPTPQDMDAESLVPTIEDPNVVSREAVVGAYKRHQRMRREDRYKLIEYAVDGERTTQLFDLERDPAETENLATDPTHADRVEAIRKRLIEQCERLGDTDARVVATDG